VNQGCQVGAEAAAQTEELWAAGIRRCREAVERGRAQRRSVADETWARINPDLRVLMLTMASTRRDADDLALLPWSKLPEAERVAVGSYARQLERELHGAGWLR
jgi:hypothetical protein